MTFPGKLLVVIITGKIDVGQSDTGCRAINGNAMNKCIFQCNNSSISARLYANNIYWNYTLHASMSLFESNFQPRVEIQCIYV